MVNLKTLCGALAGVVVIGSSALAQSTSGLFFREDWKEIEAEMPVTQAHVVHADLELSLHGPASDRIKKSYHPHIPNDPYYIWSGECRGNWAVSLRHKKQLVDLSGDARIRIRARQSGFRELRIILKLEDGSWLVSDQAMGSTPDWSEHEFRIADIRWRQLSMRSVTERDWVENPDLTRIDEVGFTDLMVGGGTPASSRLDWIEVHGRPVSR